MELAEVICVVLACGHRQEEVYDVPGEMVAKLTEPKQLQNSYKEHLVFKFIAHIPRRSQGAFQ